MAKWVKQLEILTNFACTEPRTTFSGFIHGLRHHYTHFTRIISGISHLLKPKDDAIDTFIKVLQRYAFDLIVWVLILLPTKYGGMGLITPSERIFSRKNFVRNLWEKYENENENTKWNLISR